MSAVVPARRRHVGFRVYEQGGCKRVRQIPSTVKLAVISLVLREIIVAKVDPGDSGVVLHHKEGCLYYTVIVQNAVNVTYKQ